MHICSIGARLRRREHHHALRVHLGRRVHCCAKSVRRVRAIDKAARDKRRLRALAQQVPPLRQLREARPKEARHRRARQRRHGGHERKEVQREAPERVRHIVTRARMPQQPRTNALRRLAARSGTDLRLHRQQHNAAHGRQHGGQQRARLFHERAVGRVERKKVQRRLPQPRARHEPLRAPAVQPAQHDGHVSCAVLRQPLHHCPRCAPMTPDHHVRGVVGARDVQVRLRRRGQRLQRERLKPAPVLPSSPDQLRLAARARRQPDRKSARVRSRRCVRHRLDHEGAHGALRQHRRRHARPHRVFRSRRRGSAQANAQGPRRPRAALGQLDARHPLKCGGRARK